MLYEFFQSNNKGEIVQNLEQFRNFTLFLRFEILSNCIGLKVCGILVEFPNVTHFENP